MKREFKSKAINNNEEYELLIKQIYEQILLAEGYENIKVEHNTKITGISGQAHQIDVYWEFKIADNVFRVALECKNYSKPVPLGKIRDFHSVISDIGDIKGIFVSTNGYQSGAIKYAGAYNILLKEARAPKNEDWDGFIKSLNVQLILVPTPQAKSISVGVDSLWIKNNNLDNGVPFPNRRFF